MFVLTRYGGWGMPTGDAPTPQWQHVFVLVYVLSVWGTISALGAVVARARTGRGVAAAVLGSFAGYAVLTAVLRIFPRLALAPWNPSSFMPVPVNLLDGLLSGAGLCLALSFERLLSRRIS
jgi:NADPH:quinone reductase-like Zn-dependent oxidoreductase